MSTTTAPAPTPAVDARRQGYAPIKAEYIIPRPQPSVAAPAATDDDAAEGSGKSLKRATREDGTDALDERELKAPRGESGKAKRGGGQNKGRKFANLKDDVQLCPNVANGRPCAFGDNCRMSHSVELYLKSKPEDIVIPTAGAYADSAPFVTAEQLLGVRCPTYEELGFCPQGFKCRFLAAHYKRPVEPATVGSLEVNEERKTLAEQRKGGPKGETNGLSATTLKQLSRKRYEFPIANAYVATMEGAPKPKVHLSEEDIANGVTEADVIAQSKTEADRDADDVPLKATEKRRLNWTGKPYLAPLTTTGNLPFRRLAASLGAEITCGEMALASSLVSGGKGEWSLTKRHESEKMFGVQICGSKPGQMASAAEIIAKECPDVDFVDCNIGCPIDLVFNSGAGSALMGNPTKLGKILTGMSRALGEVPMTVKMRTGIHDNSPNAHKLVPRFVKEWSAGALTIHGRSRQQRYSRLANWQYIKNCVDVLRETVEDANLPPIPIFGGGDCYSYSHYKTSMDVSGVDGIMIARGALIKPWIFTEIQEKREWDISARERLDFIRQYAEFGLTHWGSDTQGVNTTRRFLCEYLSFTHRYIPIGLLETQTVNINDRPAPYKGRNELETLLASTDSRDWVKLSEMFLGPSPADFCFNPKHKSNAYGTEEESQG